MNKATDTFDSKSHRKLVRHFDESGQAHELTFSCYKRRSLLTDEGHCLLLSEAIDRAVAGKGFELVAFVYMPEHIHLIVWPTSERVEVSKLLWAIKRPHSYRVKQLMLERGDPMATTLTIRDRPGRKAFRFWQEGGGYDRNIRSIQVLRVMVDYVHANPVRRGLCDLPHQWRWSSWNWYEEAEDTAGLPRVHGLPQ